jgi:hypothetical protein
MPMSGVLAATRTPGPPFYYFTEDALEHFPALAADIAEAGPFVRTPEHCLVSLWLGQAGVGAHAHYDAYDNVFVQLAGRKRFIIAPPDAWRVVRPFPLLHPSHAQAQRDVLAAGALAETSRQIPVWVIDLEPGDILFVPPFCWHHVVSLTANRSVNLWSLPPWAPQTDNVPGAAQRVVGRPDPSPAERLEAAPRRVARGRRTPACPLRRCSRGAARAAAGRRPRRGDRRRGAAARAAGGAAGGRPRGRHRGRGRDPDRRRGGARPCPRRRRDPRGLLIAQSRSSIDCPRTQQKSVEAQTSAEAPYWYTPTPRSSVPPNRSIW